MRRQLWVGTLAGLGWGLAVALVDGLPLFWQGTPWPHLGERLLALAYLAAIDGVIGALLGGLLAALWPVVARLFRRRLPRHPSLFVIGTLAAGTLAAACGQLMRPGLPGWVVIGIVSVAAGLGAGRLAALAGRHEPALSSSAALPGQGRRAVPIAISALFLLALTGVASSAMVLSVQSRRPSQAVPLGPDDSRASIVLITASGLRADHLGAYGYDRAISPNLDALAARGVRFGHAVAPGSWGRPSTAALLTSLYPGALGYRRDQEGLFAPAPDSMRTTLAEALRTAGYRTGAILASPWLNADGFAQGFDTFDAPREQEPFDETPMRGRMLGWLLGCGKDTAACRLYLQGRRLVLGTPLEAGQGDQAINTRAARFLDRHVGEPFFLWVNYDDALPPYDQAAPFTPIEEDAEASAGGYLRSLAFWALGDPFTAREALRPRDAAGLTSLYDGEVQRVDGLVGELLAMLDARRLTGRTVVVVTSDHGQELADHGGYTYGHSLYEEVVHVPLIAAGAGVTAKGYAVDTPVSLIDLGPTLAEMAGTALSDEALGTGLVPALEGQAIEERAVFSEALYRVPFDQQAIRSGAYKLIHREGNGQVELYDLLADPTESHDLAAERPDVAAALRDELAQWKSRMRMMERTGLPRSTSQDTTADRLW